MIVEIVEKCVVTDLLLISQLGIIHLFPTIVDLFGAFKSLLISVLMEKM